MMKSYEIWMAGNGATMEGIASEDKLAKVVKAIAKLDPPVVLFTDGDGDMVFIRPDQVVALVIRDIKDRKAVAGFGGANSQAGSYP